MRGAPASLSAGNHRLTASACAQAAICPPWHEARLPAFGRSEKPRRLHEHDRAVLPPPPHWQLTKGGKLHVRATCASHNVRDAQLTAWAAAQAVSCRFRRGRPRPPSRDRGLLPSSRARRAMPRAREAMLGAMRDQQLVQRAPASPSAGHHRLAALARAQAALCPPWHEARPLRLRRSERPPGLHERGRAMLPPARSPRAVCGSHVLTARRPARQELVWPAGRAFSSSFHRHSRRRPPPPWLRRPALRRFGGTAHDGAPKSLRCSPHAASSLYTGPMPRRELGMATRQPEATLRPPHLRARAARRWRFHRPDMAAVDVGRLRSHSAPHLRALSPCAAPDMLPLAHG